MNKEQCVNIKFCLKFEKVREFVKFRKKCPVRIKVMELGIAKTGTNCLLIENFGLRILNSKFVSNRLSDDQTLYRNEHCKDIVSKARKKIKTS